LGSESHDRSSIIHGAFIPSFTEHSRTYAMSNEQTIARRIRIVCVSDTHNDDLTGHVPAGDVFVHAGDMTDDGTQEELERALDWIRNLPHKLKVVIPGTGITSLLRPE
jgi:hypothetical protein